MKLVVLMSMKNILTMMTMLMILMMIPIFYYSTYKMPKASFKWVPDLGTSPGHEPIIDQSCGAVLFFSM